MTLPQEKSPSINLQMGTKLLELKARISEPMKVSCNLSTGVIR
jgi:hypothetical protein